MNKINLTLLIVSTIFCLNLKAESFPPPKELPGGPENKSATLKISNEEKSLELNYNGAVIFEGQLANPNKTSFESSDHKICRPWS
jgi:hypothetical protein